VRERCTGEDIHLEDGNHRAIRVDIPTFLEEFLGWFDRVQHDEDLAKDVE